MGQGVPIAHGDDSDDATGGGFEREDRLILLRLAEQVSQISERLDRLFARDAERDARVSLGAKEGQPIAWGGAEQREAPRTKGEASDRLLRAIRPPLPDPRLVRQIIRHRQLRARYFDGELFADPAWDMLLDLVVARAEHERVSVSSLCIASGVPPTTALRWIGQMVEDGLLERINDETDRRRAFIVLTPKAVDALSRYFASITGTRANPV